MIRNVKLITMISAICTFGACSAEDVLVENGNSEQYGAIVESPQEESSAETATSPLTLSAHEAKEVVGNICYMIFTSADGFPSKKDKAQIFKCVTMDANPFVIDTIELEIGKEYAISIFHDENSNEEIDLFSDTLPIPKEGLGLSTNPNMGSRPKYDDAKFIHSGDRTEMPMNLVYLFSRP